MQPQASHGGAGEPPERSAPAARIQWLTVAHWATVFMFAWDPASGCSPMLPKPFRVDNASSKGTLRPMGTSHAGRSVCRASRTDRVSLRTNRAGLKTTGIIQKSAAARR